MIHFHLLRARNLNNEFILSQSMAPCILMRNSSKFFNLQQGHAMKPIHLLALFAMLSPIAAAADEAPASETPKQGSALLVAVPSKAAYQDGERFEARVLNASSNSSLNGVHFSVTARSGFKIESNTCASTLAPKARCTLTISFNKAEKTSNAPTTLNSKSQNLMRPVINTLAG